MFKATRELYEKERQERKRIPLSPEEKKGLTNEEIFMQEFGVYTCFVYEQYWINKFKEIYGYKPERP